MSYTRSKGGRAAQTQKNNTKTNDKNVNGKTKQETVTRMPKKGGVKIGDNTDTDKWRCRTCKHLNDIEYDECQTCEDPRPGFKPKPKVEEEEQ